MKKVDTDHGSPNLKIHLSRSPRMIGGRVEMFGDITDMISYWEGKERREEQPTEPGGGRRSSKRIVELCGRFEGDGEELRSHLMSGKEGGRGI